MSRQAITARNLAVLVVCLGIACLATRPEKPDGLARISMLDIGQGDSFLIQAANGRQILIDGGRDSSVLTELSKVMPRGDRSIDVVLATHPDADHIGGLPLVINRYEVGLFLASGVATDTETFRSLYAALDERGVPAYYVRKGMTLALDQSSVLPGTFSVLFPDRDVSDWETNSASVVGRLQLGNRSALFTGDSPASIETHLAQTDLAGIDVDILKLGHHGSKTSSGEAFLRMASPALALISAGVNNRYGHPAPEVTDRLKALGIPSVSTQDVGTYTLATDGQKWLKE